jgi:hypothetical protein
MQIQGAFSIFLAGAFGGFLVELLRWYKIKESRSFPDYASRFTYWSLTILMILAGGGVAVLSGLGPINALTVLNIGASAPALIGAFAAPPQSSSPGKSTDTDVAQGGISRREKTAPIPVPPAPSSTTPGALSLDSIRQFLAFRR